MVRERSARSLVLLALWPLALLFPLVVPFGLGQVMARLEVALAQALVDSPFLMWLPERNIALQPALPVADWLCVLLGLLIPCLLGFCVIRQRIKRAWFLHGLLVLGVMTTALSAALSFGPLHAWTWLMGPAKVALVSAWLLSCVLLWLPGRACAALSLLVLGAYLSMVNQLPIDPYFEQALFLWEQGRFIRFHGLAQWLGWLWPYATLVYVLGLLWNREAKN